MIGPEPLILCIETTTHQCSVALSSGTRILAVRRKNAVEYVHAETLHPFILSILTETGIAASHISAVAVSRGPGSYTGLRIGVSAAKGLCFALGIPLIAVDSLQILCAAMMRTRPGLDGYHAMTDARRMEVYVCRYSQVGIAQESVHAHVITADYFTPFAGQKIALAGDGAEKCRPFLSEGMEILEGLLPDAEFMVPLALDSFNRGAFEDLAYFEPLYLKDFIAVPPKVSTR